MLTGLFVFLTNEGVDLAFDQLLNGIFGADFMNHFKSRLPASHVDLMVAFEARKRHASPYRCNPLNIALPFSLIDCYRKYSGKEIDAAVRKYGNTHIRWSSQGMLRLDQEAMRSLFEPTLNSILEVNTSRYAQVPSLTYNLIVFRDMNSSYKPTKTETITT